MFFFQEIRKLAEGSETFSPTTGQLYRELGSQVRARYNICFHTCLCVKCLVSILVGMCHCSHVRGILNGVPLMTFSDLKG